MTWKSPKKESRIVRECRRLLNGLLSTLYTKRDCVIFYGAPLFKASVFSGDKITFHESLCERGTSVCVLIIGELCHHGADIQKSLTDRITNLNNEKFNSSSIMTRLKNNIHGALVSLVAWKSASVFNAINNIHSQTEP
jgi:hypothetical protein